MIFVILGSQKFQFNRLLKEIDDLIEQGDINDKVFAQVGCSDYIPLNYEYKDFMENDAFNQYVNKAELVITHAGTSSIIRALKSNKKVIAVARLKQYNEHISDHQLDIISQFNQLRYIIGLRDVSQLKDALKNLDKYTFDKYVSSTNNIIKIIEEFITSKGKDFTRNK